jgi:hypothetical protein
MKEDYHMHTVEISTCPRCGNQLDAGFAVRWAGLSFVTPAKFRKHMFVDEDLSRAGLRKLLPWNAAYYESYLCRTCKLYLVDYGETYSRRQAREIAASLSRE